MKVAVDSNRYTDFCRGDERARSILRLADEIYVPLIVLAELRAGFAHGSRRAENEKLLTRFLNTKRVQIVVPDEATTQHYAELYAMLRRKDRPIPTNDLWIAALVLQHSLLLFDRDSDFDAIPQLARIG